MYQYIITLLSGDKPGIIADISSAISLLEGNISEVNQTVVKGYFTIIVFASFPRKVTEQQLSCAVCGFRPEESKDYHINLVEYKEPRSPKNAQHERYVLTIKCNEQSGIISEITSYLYGRGINIEDFYAYIAKGTPYMLAQIAVPDDGVADEIRADLEALGRKWNLTVTLSHENIYIATNTVCPTIKLV
ncbi:MAG: hypothetical protein ILO36_04860 [Abditibacteriota bacterium]|nr:hypothetical protein [Abditibacteriota bacterium]